MYDSSDPRSTLPAATVAGQPVTVGEVDTPQVFHLTESAPDRSTDAGSASRFIRTANCVLGITTSAGPDEFDFGEIVDESILVLPDDMGAQVSSGPHEAPVDAASVVIVPPGTVRVRTHGEGTFVLVASAANPGLLRGARNDAHYRPVHASIDRLPTDPASRPPAASSAIRVHRLDQLPSDGDRFGRIFRSHRLMVNLLVDESGPRDPDRLSPHVHAGFEQCSVTLRGDYVHHLRAPWTPRLADWREDVHVRCASPSVLIIPPGIVHTTQGVGDGLHRMLDVFAPPRKDFLDMPGWVLNGADYPQPVQ